MSLLRLQVTQETFGENARPAVFALSNPVEEAECTAQQAYDWTDGAAVFASGTAFAPVRRNDGSTFLPGQCNNCLVFPGKDLHIFPAALTGMFLAPALLARLLFYMRIACGWMSDRRCIGLRGRGGNRGSG